MLKRRDRLVDEVVPHNHECADEVVRPALNGANFASALKRKSLSGLSRGSVSLSAPPAIAFVLSSGRAREGACKSRVSRRR